MIVCVVFISCFVVIFIYLNLIKNGPTKSKEIPLEKGLPIIGIVKNIKEPFCNYLFKLNKKHGAIFQIRFGMRKIVVLNTFEYIKAALLDSGDAFNGRWKSEKYVFVANNAGLVFIDGEVWAEQRAFVLKTLKEFGIGRSRSVEIVQEECGHMLDDLKQVKGQTLNLAHFLFLYTVNVITKFVMNKRFSRHDPELDALQKYMAVLITDNDPVSNVSLMFPFFDNHEWLMRFIMWVTSRKSLADGFHQFIKKDIEEHSSRLDPNSEGDDLIDRFLIKQHRMKEERQNVGTFTDWQLIRNTFELLLAGIDSTSVTLEWNFMFMAMYPDIQTKVYNEIIDQIGKERMVTMSDKVSLVYTQAVLDEVLRLASTAPLSAMHRALSDVNIEGYCIPVGTLIIPNLLACHLDPNVWEKPFEFCPEHFLLTNSEGELKYRPREELIVFSMGKRQCLGESLARMEFFIFFVSILQRFQVGIVNEKRNFDVFNGKEGLIRKPKVEDFFFIKREKR